MEYCCTGNCTELILSWVLLTVMNIYSTGVLLTPLNIYGTGVLLTVPNIYRVSQKERTKLRESVPYVKLYRYIPKHLYPKLNGYGDIGQRKVWTSCISAYCTSTAV